MITIYAYMKALQKPAPFVSGPLGLAASRFPAVGKDVKHSKLSRSDPLCGPDRPTQSNVIVRVRLVCTV